MSLESGNVHLRLVVDGHIYEATGETSRDAFLLAAYKFANTPTFEEVTHQLCGDFSPAVTYSVETLMPSQARERAKKPHYPAKFERTVTHAYVTHLRECVFQWKDINYDWKRLAVVSEAVKVALEGGGVYHFDAIIPDSILHLNKKARDLSKGVMGVLNVNTQEKNISIDKKLFVDTLAETMLNIYRVVPDMVKKEFGCELVKQQVHLYFTDPNGLGSRKYPFRMSDGQIHITMN